MLYRTSFLNGALSGMNHELDRFFRDIVPSAARPAARFVPAVDVREEGDQTVLVADLPGVSPDDVKLVFENGVLILSGERKEPEHKAATYHKAERIAGEFERRFALPADADGEKITASHEHGVLTVTIPKRPEARTRTIEIKR